MRIRLTVGLGLVFIGVLDCAPGFTQPRIPWTEDRIPRTEDRIPRTETDLRATIAEQNIRSAESTQEFAENLRGGPVTVELDRMNGMVERFLAVPGPGEALPDIELDAAKGFVAVLEAHPADLRSPGKVMLQLSPKEAEWSAALLTAGAFALGRTGRTDEGLFEALVSVALGGTSRADLLTRFVLTGGKGIDQAEQLRLDDDILARLNDLLGRHPITKPLQAGCEQELSAAAAGLAGAASPPLQPTVPNIAPVTGINPNHGRPGTVVVLSGNGWPATQPPNVEVVFTSNRGTTNLRATVNSWGPPRGLLGTLPQITVIAPSDVGFGPVGFVSVPPTTGGNPAAGLAMAGAIEHCLGARGSAIAGRFANWLPPAALTITPGVQPGGINLFTGGPQITGVLPLTVHEGDTVTITGHEFANGDGVTFAGASSSSVFRSDVSLTAVVPTVLGGQRSVQVYIPPNNFSNGLSVQILPTLTSLSQGQTTVGELVNAIGSGFNRDTFVYATEDFPGSTAATVVMLPMTTSFIDAHTVQFTGQLTNVPAGGRTVQVMVKNPDGALAGPLPWVVLPPPLSGWVDLHTHPMVNLGFGGKLVHGGVDIGSLLPTLLPQDTSCDIPVRAIGFRATSMEHALGEDRRSHGGYNLVTYPCGNEIRKIVIETFQRENNAFLTAPGALGFPNFDQWPRWNDITHQKMWFEWIRRARDGGLRVMIALATNNKTLGDAVSGIDDGPTDDKASADLQLTEIKAFVNRHNDFMEIALRAADIERIVRANKIAVVLGVEIDDIGNFNKSALDSMNRDAARKVISDEIQRLYNSGVRYIFPVHLIDNHFGGTAIYKNLFNTSNLREWGRFWDIECADVEDKITYTYTEETNILRDLAGVKLGLDPLRHAGPGPVCPPPGDPIPSTKSSGHRNARELKWLGATALREMMRRGMIIDIDHMSQKTADTTLGIAKTFGYPLVSGHTGIRGLPGAIAENSRTPLQLQRLSELHGMFGLGSDGVHAHDWAPLYQQAVSSMGYMNPDPMKANYQKGAVAFGTDLNGFVSGPQPGNWPASGFWGPVTTRENRVVYSAAFPMSSSGTKTWNYNTEGVAHYGMLPDFIADVRTVSDNSNDLVNNHLFRSADYFWHMWERIEAQKTTIPTDLPSLQFPYP